MAVNNFSGETFLAYLDISGFKEHMKDGRAIDAMDQFYQAGCHNRVLFQDVEVFFISDCGILFVRENHTSNVKLCKILNAVRAVRYIVSS